MAQSSAPESSPFSSLRNGFKQGHHPRSRQRCSFRGEMDRRRSSTRGGPAIRDPGSGCHRVMESVMGFPGERSPGFGLWGHRAVAVRVKTQRPKHGGATSARRSGGTHELGEQRSRKAKRRLFSGDRNPGPESFPATGTRGHLEVAGHLAEDGLGGGQRPGGGGIRAAIFRRYTLPGDRRRQECRPQAPADFAGQEKRVCVGKILTAAAASLAGVFVTYAKLNPA